MAFVCKSVLITSLFLVGLLKVQGARIEISPSGFIEAVTDTISVTCSPDGTGARASEILVMEISKDGDTPIVNIQPPSKIRYGDAVDRDHFEAVGVVNNSDIPNSMLNLTIRYPSGKEDAGTYTCVMSYIDETGLVKQDTAQADLMVNTSDALSIESRVSNLQTALDNLLERVKVVEKDNKQLQDDKKNLSQQIDSLRERVTETIAFSAAVSAKKVIVTDDILVFSDVIINEGQGYNSTTGIFTAPNAGVYAFHLVLEIGEGGAVGEIALNVAGHNLAKMYTQDKEFGDQSSVTAVSRLRKGDRVMAKVVLAAGSAPKVLAERLCVFSGYLVRT